MKIEVTIEAREFARATNDIHIMMRMLERMRAAGIPVRGNLGITGVERGRLSISDDAFGDMLIEWEDA